MAVARNFEIRHMENLVDPTIQTKEWWRSIMNTNANMQENVIEDIKDKIDVLIHNMAIEL